MVAGQTADYAWLAVQDACGGIDPDDLPRVFDVAFRGAVGPVPGAGVARPAAPGWGWPSPEGWWRRTAGEISVHNEGPGCRFEVRLPVAV